jgi:hypothetical protein
MDAVERDAKAFAGVARRFIAALESAESGDRTILLDRLLGVIADLYASASMLRNVEPGENDLEVQGDLEAAKTLVAEVVGVLGADANLEIWDPFGDEERPVGGLLTDDLIDLALELRKGLAFLAAGSPVEAIWHWQFTFESHWGYHAVDALRALHTLRYAS